MNNSYYKEFNYNGKIHFIPKCMLFYVEKEDLKKNLYLVYPKVEIRKKTKKETNYFKNIKKEIDKYSWKDYFWFLYK